MKFNFKIQQYQTDAVQAVINVFQGQTQAKNDDLTYDIDKGIVKSEWLRFRQNFNEKDSEYIGYRNNALTLSDEELLKNIHAIQSENDIKHSESFKISEKTPLKLDIEMETGTGKTYVYIKTMFELNRMYGFSKFIIVVPSIAIREGVKKSLEITQDHFMQDKNYGKKARFFVYNSSNLHQLEDFSKNSSIQVMIINTQAFATSLKEDGRSKESRIIYSKRDDFASRRPIDVIKENHPILILDEPQKMGGDTTKKAILYFNPLFILNYSATHKKTEVSNMIYVLDALEAYNQRLVKKIEVKGFELKNLKGTDGYLYLEDFVLSKKEAPKVKLEIEHMSKSGTISRKTFICKYNDDLFYKSGEMTQYKGFTIAEINPLRGTVTFANNETISKNDVINDKEQKKMRRIQIRETIKSHFEKEEKLFEKDIKTLSLFFIDEVANYRQYDKENNELLGEYGRIFEEEYIKVYNEYITLLESPYQKYLKEKCNDASKVHKGYFSIDKGKVINSSIKRGSDISDDISAYDLILKNKERLLSFDEPTRFIFSHSALREGWDNPNVFQICTLKHSDSQIGKRQEVGRGLRLCVDSTGNRIDKESLGASVHEINKLTVIASESYTDFVTQLQKETLKELYERPTKASIEYFKGKTITVNGEKHSITEKQASLIYKYLAKNDYTDDNDSMTNTYHNAVESNSLAPLPEDLQDISEQIHTLIQAIFNPSVLETMVEDANKTKIKENNLNENFAKKEFQALWGQINHKYAYTVLFNSDELIEKTIKAIDETLHVTELKYTVTTGTQTTTMTQAEIERGESFALNKNGTKSEKLETSHYTHLKYDLIGKIATNTHLTRKTVVEILSSISHVKFLMFRQNPEEFIPKVIKIINEQKATMIVEHIQYNKTRHMYDAEIFTKEKPNRTFDSLLKAEKNVQDYVEVDSSIERNFTKQLEAASEVCVYAKLPRSFKIPTPVGDYAPDFAISFYKGKVKHIYFIAETKGSMNSLELRPIEQAKINCAKKLFNEISTDEVRYHEVNNYENLLNVMNGIG